MVVSAILWVACLCAHHFAWLCRVFVYQFSVPGLAIHSPTVSSFFALKNRATDCLLERCGSLSLWTSRTWQVSLSLGSCRRVRRMLQGGQGGAWAFLLVSREGGGQGDFPSPSVNGLMENSSGQLPADSAAGLRAGPATPAFCLLMSSQHVQFLLLQRRGKRAACHHMAREAEWGAFRWRPEVSPCLFPFLSSQPCSGPWTVGTVGIALC